MRSLSTSFIFCTLALLASSAFAQGINTLNGEWYVSRGVLNGEGVPDDVLESMTLNVTNGDFTANSGGLKSTGKFSIAGAADEMAVTIDNGADKGRVLNAKWRMESGTLTVAYSQDGNFPASFDSKSGSNILVLYYSPGKRPVTARNNTGGGNRAVVGRGGNIRPSVNGANQATDQTKSGGGGAMVLD